MRSSKGWLRQLVDGGMPPHVCYVSEAVMLEEGLRGVFPTFSFFHVWLVPLGFPRYRCYGSIGFFVSCMRLDHTHFVIV